jgi:hypothetical protein
MIDAAFSSEDGAGTYPINSMVKPNGSRTAPGRLA